MPNIDGSRDIRDDSIQSIDIKDGSITNLDISSSANIAASKLNISWKEPVDSLINIPTSGVVGDCMVVKDEETIYMWDGDEYKAIISSGTYSSTNFNTDFSLKTTNDLAEGTTNKYFFSHNNSSHTENYIKSSDVTFEVLNTNGDIGTGSSQLATGDHTHPYILSSGGLVSGNLNPSTNYTCSLGTAELKWADIYCNTLHTDASTIYIGDESISVDGGKLVLSTGISLPTSSTLETDRINITSINPADTATIFGTDNSGDSTLHIRIGNGTGDKLSIESYNGSSATELLGVNQDTVTILGNLVVSGTTTTVNSTVVEVVDSSFIIGNSSSAINKDGTFEVKQESGSAVLKYKTSSGEWEAGNSTITAPIFTARTTQADGRFDITTTMPIATDRLNYNGCFYATKVYNAVWNDYADFQLLLDNESIPGICYYETGLGLTKCSKRAQKGVVGICTDTFGTSVGNNSKQHQVPIAVSGWVLAHIDKKYTPGTLLLNDKNGNLTKVKWYERLFLYERVVAIYARDENNEVWNGIKVNNRHWVKCI